MIQNIHDKFKLHNGTLLPGFGFGTAQAASGSVTIESVKMAIKAGYRNIDTAAAYQNEQSVGEGIRQAMEEYGISREEIFVSTKLWHTERSYDKALKAFEVSMKKLGLEYLDLYMIHWPAVEKWHEDWREINHDTWRALEELYREGRVKSIGVSNFLVRHIRGLMEDSEIMPMVNQIEYHPGFAQTESAEFCKKNGIIVEAWSPFGTGEVLQNKTLKEIAAAHEKSTAHICLRWLIQKEIVPISKSVHEERIISNTEVFDFILTEEEMKRIDEIPFCGGMHFDPSEAKS